MAKNKSRSIFICQNCGAQSMKWQGKCHECGSWNTFQEEVQVALDPRRGFHIGEMNKNSNALDFSALSDIQFDSQTTARYSTHIEELDRTLGGGGVVPGSFILLGGDPGIGKSTLLLQMSKGLSDNNLKVLYVSGEESVQQTRLRASRLKTVSDKVFIASESNLENILQIIQKVGPQIVIVDSVQTVYLPALESAPGTVSQVRECANKLMVLAKTNNIAVFLIGHVTKEGNIAGPKVLEHMVDTVLSFEGDLHHQFRLLRALKNRFGTTNELGVFQMATSGLKEVKNPSELFLEERKENRIGSSVLVTIEGSRALLCEIQALSQTSYLPMPRRTSVGVDIQRLHLLLAVLDKYIDMDLAKRDVFVNVVGGLKITEPAQDLAIAASIISSENDQEIMSEMCFFGEVGLTGEVRAVILAENRIREASKLGFHQFVVPLSNKKHLLELPKNIQSQIIYIKNIKELPGILKQKNKLSTKSLNADLAY